MRERDFFDTTPPASDPGNVNPEDRPFLNFSKRQQTRQSTLPTMPPPTHYALAAASSSSKPARSTR